MVALLLREKILAPLSRQLTQGVSPDKLALAIAVGAVCGILPLWGATTWLCVALGVAFRLNQVAIQVANYAVYPLQLLFYIPFIHAGALLFGAAPVELTPEQIAAAFRADSWGALAKYGVANLRGVVAWALLVPVTTPIIRMLVRPLMQRLIPRNSDAG